MLDMNKSLGTLALLLVGLSGIAQGQQTSVVYGRILDAESRAPVAAAFVGWQGSNRGVLSDVLGEFTLPVESSASRVLRVNQLGYHQLLRDTRADTAGTPLVLLLSPDPVQVEGLTVLAERLAERRRGPYGVADILERSDLLESAHGSGYELVMRMLPFVDLCSMESEALCMSGRTMMGQRREVTVCVDGNKVPPHLMQTALSGVDPRGMYLVETYPRAGHVRMYSPGFLKRLIDAGMSLPPLSFGCGGVGD